MALRFPANFLLRYKPKMPSSKGVPTDPELREELKEGKATVSR